MAESVVRCRALQLQGGSDVSSQEAVLHEAEARASAASGAELRGSAHEALNLSYGEHPRQKVDLYWPAHLPQPTAGWPTLVIMHGELGTKRLYKGICKARIIPSGRACLAGNYRTEDEYRADDIYAMFTWFYGKADQYSVDKANIVLSGYSLGSLTINNIIWDKKMGQDLLDGETPKVKAVMMLSGVAHHHQHDAEEASYFPKSTFIMSSDADTVVPYGYSVRLYHTLARMDKKVAFHNIPGAGHNVTREEYRDQWCAAILNWLADTIPSVHALVDQGMPTDVPMVVNKDRGVKYGSEEIQAVDIYWPAIVAKPVQGWSAVIFVHGGNQTKESMQHWCITDVLPTGRLCVSADYRQGVVKRDKDIYQMLTWFTSEETLGAYEVNHKAIVLCGYSWGGMTINEVIWDKETGQRLLKPEPEPAIKAVMTISGIMEAHPHRARHAEYFPRFNYVMSSDTDADAPYKYSVRMVRQLGRLGQRATLISIPGAGHNIPYSTEKDQMHSEIRKFLDKTIPAGKKVW